MVSKYISSNIIQATNDGHFLTKEASTIHVMIQRIRKRIKNARAVKIFNMVGHLAQHKSSYMAVVVENSGYLSMLV